MTLLTGNIVVDGVRLAYRDQGRGMPVIFIHGTPSHSYEWRDVVPHIEAGGFRAVTYDLLGYGRSERPVDRDTSVAAQTDLLAHLLDALDIDRADIVAHDIGGAIGLRFAVARPERVRRLLVIDSVSYDSWRSPTWRRIIDEHLDDCMSMSQEAFDDLLTRQLAMTVADASLMTGDVLRAYLAPHRSTLGRASLRPPDDPSGPTGPTCRRPYGPPAPESDETAGAGAVGSSSSRLRARSRRTLPRPRGHGLPRVDVLQRDRGPSTGPTRRGVTAVRRCAPASRRRTGEAHRWVRTADASRGSPGGCGAPSSCGASSRT
ncbi:alpha/beta fold hydrolase [Streptomyces sp. NPDC006996]|uniref:alpha/beta fold hydrolase n=1 Tax=Streptomyces sp. NPDC006996 TaxID=3156908 RepID=UPI0033DF6A56